MIEILVLYILNRYDATIYKIAKIIETNFFAYAKPSFGTINPALKRLEELGCIEYISKITEGGKLSKLYSITEHGRAHLSKLMLEFPLNNPSSLVNSVNTLLFCSEVLGEGDKKTLLNYLLNHLNIYKIDIEKKLDDPYLDYSDLQRKVLQNTYSQVGTLAVLLEHT